jgi:SAM-dependent methyltransferase
MKRQFKPKRFTVLGGYTTCAPYYRCLTGNSDFVEPQFEVVRQLIRRHRLDGGKCLDAACANADVLDLLVRKWYDAVGSDGSPEMLALAKRLPSPLRSALGPTR